MSTKRQITIIALSALIVAAVFVLTFIIAYQLACIISPAYIEGDNGERYPVMVIGQVMVGLAVATILSIFTAYISYKKLKKKRN